MKYFIQNIRVLPQTYIASVLMGGMLLFGQATNAQQKKATKNVEGNTPSTRQKKVTKVSASSKAIQNVLLEQVEGIVVSSSTQKPVSGVRVFYKDLSSSITKEDGTFKLKIPNNQVVIGVEGSGYKSYDVAVKGQKTLRLVVSDFDGVDNTYKLPTKTVSEYYRTDAAGTASLPDSWSAITETPDTYLQGRIAGLQAIRHSGTANAGAFMTIRGYNSIQANNRPLVVMDGVIYDAAVYGESTINNFFDNPFSYIDPRDITNVTVLKDASAAALYGTKAANGVILITTSRAQELGTKIDFSMYGGVNVAPTSLPVMNATNFRTYLNDLMVSAGLSNAQIQAQEYMNDSPSSPTYYANHNETDWQKKIYAARPLANMYLRITGGDNIAKYALSMNYLSNKNSLEGSTLEKYSTRFNADLNLTRRLTAAANLSFGYNESDNRDLGLALKTNPIYLSLTKSPFLTDKERSIEGVFSPRFTDSDIFNVGNPAVASQNVIGANRSYRFQGILDFKYKLSSALNLGSNIAVTFDKTTENHFIPSYGLVPDTLSNILAERTASALAKKVFNLYTETYLSFAKTFGHKHDFTGRTGLRFIRSSAEQDMVFSYNAAIDEITFVQRTSPLYNQIKGGIGSYNWLNTYLTLNYGYAGKYFVSLNAALDGSSRFGKQIESSEAVKIGNTSFALMPSATVAWVVSSEKFMANTGIDLLKLRASAGRVGNDDIGNYASQKYFTGQNLLGSQGLVVANVANPGLKWETVTKLNAGLDFVALKQRLSLSVDLFNHKTTDMLVYSKAPSVSGLTSYLLTNEGGMSTSGIDVTLNLNLINKQQLKWDLGLTLAKSETTVDKLPENFVAPAATFTGGSYLTTVGQAPNVFYGVVAKGVYATDGEAAQDGLSSLQANGSYKSFKGGDVRFVDVNGDKIIDEKDNQIIGNPNPDFYGGLNNRISYKNWSLDALVSFVYGNDVYNYTRRKLESGSSYENQTNALVNRWRTQGQMTDIPRVTYGDPLQNSRFSSRWIEDGSYVRLRKMTLAYNFNLNKEYLKYLTIYATANNLVTLTNYLGFDPEFSSTNSLYGQGVDNMLEPMQKSFHLGIKLGL